MFQDSWFNIITVQNRSVCRTIEILINKQMLFISTSRRIPVHGRKWYKSSKIIKKCFVIMHIVVFCHNLNNFLNFFVSAFPCVGDPWNGTWHLHLTRPCLVALSDHRSTSKPQRLGISWIIFDCFFFVFDHWHACTSMVEIRNNPAKVVGIQMVLRLKLRLFV